MVRSKQGGKDKDWEGPHESYVFEGDIQICPKLPDEKITATVKDQKYKTKATDVCTWIFLRKSGRDYLPLALGYQLVDLLSSQGQW